MTCIFYTLWPGRPIRARGARMKPPRPGLTPAVSRASPGDVQVSRGLEKVRTAKSKPKQLAPPLRRRVFAGLVILLFVAALSLVSFSSVPSAAATPGYVVNGTGHSNVEQAHASLLGEGYKVYLILVSYRSTGVEGQIYRDLIARHFRSTTGPDEGIDTRGEFCYPNCVFVPVQDANVIGASGWVGVLRHEYRHITQAENNSNMAHDFRSPNGVFTSYAAFSEACADYGLNEALVYHAGYRINRLTSVLGIQQQTLIDAACSGNMSAYQNLVARYNQQLGNPRAFAQWFPPYR